MIRVLCLAFVVVSASCKLHGPVNKNCCPPQQFEAKLDVSGGAVQGGTPLGIQGYGVMAADMTVKKTVLIVNQAWGTMTLNTKTIMDFNTKVQYAADMISQKCTKFNLTMPYDGGCVPSSLYPVGNAVVGGEEDTLNVMSYKGPLSMTGTTMNVSMDVTKDGCLPVGETVSASFNNMAFFMVYGFFNITIGIKDPSIFDVPYFCN